MSQTKLSPGSKASLRAAIVGTGYIADFHARALLQQPGVDLVAACDPNLNRAQSFAGTWKIPHAFNSLAALFREVRTDCVHILAPPDLHFGLATEALEARQHVFLEKPMCTSVEEAKRLIELARQRGLYLGVSHNFLFTTAFEKLRKVIREKQLGPIDHIAFTHFYELGQIRFGPFDLWMLRSPGNVILETAPHILSALFDLVGEPDDMDLVADRAVTLPTGVSICRRWRMRTTIGRTAIDININFAPGFPQRTIYARGLFGSALLDFDADTCVVDKRTPLEVDLDRYKRSCDLARQTRSQARSVLAGYALGKLKLAKGASPFQNSIQRSTTAFYAAIQNSQPLDSRISDTTGCNVIEHCSQIIARSGIERLGAKAPSSPTEPTAVVANPTILVLGGAGFIGKELVRQLLVAGYCVRAMIRGSTLPLEELKTDKLEIVRGDIGNPSDLDRAMSGVEYVYHLAHAQSKTWDQYWANDVETTRLVGEACLIAGIKRLVYTGTIDSYYAGGRAHTITERTPFDPNIRRRNYYARAKAAAESVLTEMSKTRKLPLVVMRPGIVIGRGGNPFHWGVGRFTENVCEVWGDGHSKLPFVLVSDVAAALVRAIEVPGIEGKSFNLIDTPLLTARDYLRELEERGDLKLTVIYRPIWQFYLVDLAKWIVKILVRHPDRIRIPSYSDWDSRTQRAYFDCGQARSTLGWVPASQATRLAEDGIALSLQPWLDATK